METEHVDVFICGAGPVGLLLAYQLARMNISTYVIGKS
jgi:2-polyprenyl-6-methoxyphenol hydroxylase-like FAD-dependent oxidoreductase